MARTEKLTPNAFNAVVGIVLNGTFIARKFLASAGSPRSRRKPAQYRTTYAAANCGSDRRAFACAKPVCWR